MNPFLTRLGMACIFATCAFACSNDPEGPPGKFTFNKNTYDVSAAYSILDDKQDDGSDTYYYWSLYLTSDDILFNTADKQWQGKGEAVILFFTALNDNGIVPTGTYDTNNKNGSGAFYIDFNIGTGIGDKHENVESTQFTITKSGNTFTIDFTAKLATGEVINGTYTGSITNVNY